MRPRILHSGAPSLRLARSKRAVSKAQSAPRRPPSPCPRTSPPPPRSCRTGGHCLADRDEEGRVPEACVNSLGGVFTCGEGVKQRRRERVRTAVACGISRTAVPDAVQRRNREDEVAPGINALQLRAVRTVLPSRHFRWKTLRVGPERGRARVLRQPPPLPDSRSLEMLSQPEATQGGLVRVLRLAAEGSATNQSKKDMHYQDYQGVSVC